MITTLRIQKNLQPYNLESNNKLEVNEIVSGTFTIYAIIIFDDREQNVPTINLLVYVAGKC